MCDCLAQVGLRDNQGIILIILIDVRRPTHYGRYYSLVEDFELYKSMQNDLRIITHSLIKASLF